METKERVTGDSLGDLSVEKPRLDSFVVIDPSSSISSDSGGGSSGKSIGTVPAALVPATPPTPLLRGGAASTRRKYMSLPDLPSTPNRRNSSTRYETCDLMTQTEGHSFMTFSPKTCYELLRDSKLSKEQIFYEFSYFKSRGCTGLSDLRTNTRNSAPPAHMIEELKQVLNHQVHSDFSDTMSLLESITSSVSYLAEKADIAAQFVEAFECAQESAQESPVTLKSEGDGNETAFFSPVSVEAPNITPDLSSAMTEEENTVQEIGNFALPNSVCQILDTKIYELSVSDVIQQIDFPVTMRGGRKTAYFGSHPYSYGRVTHEAKPYPSIPLFTNIFNGLRAELGAEFTPTNYTCLVTLYENGSVGIPKHSDNEEQIVPDSKIITLSIGATRTLKFLNNIGKIRETDIAVENGTVFSMDAASQRNWSHCLTIDHSVTEPRISFTFRRLHGPPDHDLPDPTIPARTIPPIRQPEPVRPRIDGGSHRRILFLTDSVLKDTPEHIFNRIGGNDHYRCIKKVNYELANVFNFEPEFAYSDVVVISCGVNDLARYGRRPEVLADLVISRLRKCCMTHKNTNFVFTSLLSTAYDWLNVAIGSFNRFMFKLAAELPNLAFFDSHQILLSSPMSRSNSKTLVLQPNADGVNITFEARKLVTSQLINGLDVIVAGRESRPVNHRLFGWKWPLRLSFLSMVDRTLTVFGGGIARAKC